MKMPIGFKTANPAKTDGIVDDFYKPLVAAGIAPVVMSIDSGGHCYDVQKLVAGTPLERRAVMHFRRTGDPAIPSGMDVPDYDADADADADRMWRWHADRWPRELRRDLVWTGITNEPRQEASEWLAVHARRLCELALRDGHRLTVFGWAAGTPREDAWTKPEMTRLLDLLRQHPEQLALGLHEYSYEAHTLDSPLVGRWTRVIPKPWPSILILEFGWAYNAAPEHPAGIPQIVEAYRKWYAYPQVKGLGLWTLDKGRGGRDLPDVIHRYMGPLAAAIRDTDIDAPPLGEEPPPVVPEPEPEPANRFANGSFEAGWYHPDGVPELQMPAGWDLKWRDGNEPGWANPFDGAAHSRFVRPEIRTLPAAQLPPAERPLFIRDGAYTLKAFKGRGALYFSLMQTVAGLAPGRYRVSLPVFADLVKAYDNERKVWADDPNAGLARVRVGPVVVTGTPGDGPFGGGWVRLKPGEWNTLAAEFPVTSGAADVKVDFLLPFALPQNGIFADTWSMTAAATEPPPPPPPARPVKVVDISRWQGAINPARMIAAGVDGVMVRASYAGTAGSKADERADEYAAQLKAAGIPWGFYHYFHPARPWEEQYAAFAAVVRRHGYRLRLALDLEEQNGAGNLTPEHARQFAARMAADFPLPAGKRHLIYTSGGYWGGTLGRPAWGADYELWIAAWTAAAAPVVPAPWARWSLWQHASDGDGAAHGVGSARIDLNRFNGTAADFAAWRVDVPPAGETPPGLSFAARMMALGEASRLVTRTPDFAIEKAMIADGFAPTGEEWRGRVDETGPVYAYRPAASLDGRRARTYYAVDGDWGAVRWTDGTEPATPPPPARPTVDLLPFLRGEHRRQFDMGYDGADGSGTQTVQVWHLSDTDWLYVKGGGQYERLGLRDWNGQEWIWRFEDTSESAERFYTHALRDGGPVGAPWFPRHAEVGRWYETSKHVRHYLKVGCVPQNGGSVTDRLRLVSRPRPVTYAASLGRLDEIVTLEWAGGEQYDFARGRGCVAFRDARRTFWYIGDVHGRPDRPYVKPPCLPSLGW